MDKHALPLRERQTLNEIFVYVDAFLLTRFARDTRRDVFIGRSLEMQARAFCQRLSGITT